MIQAEGLSKRYGDLVAVDGVSFSIARGEVVGFLGPNGAGKTTTLRLLTGFLPPTDGTAVIAGHDIFDDPIRARRAIGYLPETPPLYPEMTVQDYLVYVARIKDVARARRREAVERALERTVLTEVRRQVIGTLSKGYRQRVGIAQAIVHSPQVLILDEPSRARSAANPGDPHADRRAGRPLSGGHPAHRHSLDPHPRGGRCDLPPCDAHPPGTQSRGRPPRRAHQRRAQLGRDLHRADFPGCRQRG